MDKKRFVYFCCIIAATASVVTWLLTSAYMNSNTKNTELRLEAESYDEISDLLDITDLEAIIEQYYYREVDGQVLMDGALKGMVEALDDPYSVYYPEDEYKEYMRSNDGTFVGVGVSFMKDEQTGYLVVVNVFDESPAAASGIVVGDMIKSIDGVNVSKMSSEEAADSVQGPVGSSVSLVLIRDGMEVTMELVRAEVQEQFVFYTMYGSTCYVIISEFHGDVSADFEKAIQFAKDEGATGMIVDIRGNLGGSVRECTEIADLILPEGLIVYTENREGERTEYMSDAEYFDIPLVMLVNGASASSSEILAGAVLDHGRGVIVGTQTYGKGVVQSTVDMPYSGGGVKLTSSVYHTPSGKSINGVGITPNYEVELPEEVLNGTAALSYDTDTQLQKALEILSAPDAAPEDSAQ